MKVFAIAVLALLLLPAASFAKTMDECIAELTQCTNDCCEEHGGVTVQESSTTRCTAFEDQRDFQSTCLDPCLTPYNYCMMGTSDANTGGVPGLGMCCAVGLLLPGAGLAAVLLVSRR